MTPRHASPLVRLLRNPGGNLGRALAALEHVAVHLWPFALAACALAAALLIGAILIARLRQQRGAAEARLVQLAVPPVVEVEGALLLWSALHDLLRPRFARLLGGQPQLAWEIAADRGGSQFRLWLPAAVPPGLVERALASAWPGITTQLVEPPADATSAAASESEMGLERG
jgi:hypothetical protein